MEEAFEKSVLIRKDSNYIKDHKSIEVLRPLWQLSFAAEGACRPPTHQCQSKKGRRRWKRHMQLSRPWDIGPPLLSTLASHQFHMSILHAIFMKECQRILQIQSRAWICTFLHFGLVLVWCPSKQAEQHNNSASCCANLDRIAEEGPFLCPLQPQPFWPFWNSIQRIVLQNAPDNASKRLQPYIYIYMHIHFYIDI